jgi:hypothetical protein
VVEFLKILIFKGDMTLFLRHTYDYFCYTRYNLTEYINVDATIATAALASVRRHAWYLTPELIVLSLFDESLSNAARQDIANELLAIPKPAVFLPGKPDFDQINLKLDRGRRPALHEFVTGRTWLFFHLVGIDTEWLRENVEDWQDNINYKTTLDIAKDIAVVNDCAERAVKDVEEYANLTKDSAHKDNIILVANDHRAKLPKLYPKQNLNNV